MLHYLTMGTVLGLSAGFAPGPLLTLVISETLRHGISSGVKVALAPVVTDLPIVILTFLVFSKLSGFHDILGVISLLGGCFVLYMGYEGIRTRGVDISAHETEPKSLAKGVVTNLLSPHPYLFWFGVGAPIMTKALSMGVSSATAFIFGFYFFLVGSKIVLAIIVGKSGSFLRGNVYIAIQRLLGLVLCALAIVLFKDGLQLLGIV